MKISDELFRYTQTLNRVPMVDQTRLCLLVDQEEWDALGAEMKALRRYYSDDPIDGGIERIFINRVEVRKR